MSKVSKIQIKKVYATMFLLPPPSDIVSPRLIYQPPPPPPPPPLPDTIYASTTSSSNHHNGSWPPFRVRKPSGNIFPDTQQVVLTGGKYSKNVYKKVGKKEVLGKDRVIYKMKGSNKEYLKTKGMYIPVSEYKKLKK